MKAETEAMCQQAKEHQRLQANHREAGSQPRQHLDLDFWTPKQRENKFLLFQPFCLWYFVTAALANSDMIRSS